MYRDNTLVPAEAVRLAALGALIARERRYSELAEEVRHFSQRITGPSLDLVGAPLEVMIVEGLMESRDGRGMEDNALLCMTEAGRDEFHRLMTSNLRAPVNDLSKLIIALKLRFLHLLPRDDALAQADLLVEMCERELARLTDLRGGYAQEDGHLPAWLDQEIAQTRARLAWYEELAASFD
ncbi:MAG: hypothetical protein R3316_01345 [Rhodovibrionaceae bacterium]|nr:hypothetical protein [Rhodovibrionaceae bacterium]